SNMNMPNRTESARISATAERTGRTTSFGWSRSTVKLALAMDQPLAIRPNMMLSPVRRSNRVIVPRRARQIDHRTPVRLTMEEDRPVALVAASALGGSNGAIRFRPSDRTCTFRPYLNYRLVTECEDEGYNRKPRTDRVGRLARTIRAGRHDHQR